MPEGRTAVAPPPASPRAELVGVLSEITAAVAGSLELREVFPRVTRAVHRLVEFDALAASLYDDGETWRLYAVGTDRDLLDEGRRIPMSSYSPAFLAFVRSADRTGDLQKILDPEYPRDREVLATGARSMARVPLRAGERLLGYLSVIAYRTDAFTDADAAALAPVADLVAMALEHERLSRLERESRRRHAKLDALLPAIASALDVRDVFGRISEIAADVLPHDRLSLGLLQPDGRTVRILAYSGDRIEGLPDTFQLAEHELLAKEWEFEIIQDAKELRDHVVESDRTKLLLANGVQSALRVPIRLEGKVAGGLVFLSQKERAYCEEDVEIARRVADEVALALSHQRLAEEARRTEEARAEAARLEERVARLTEELESRDGFARIVGSSKSWRDVLVQASKVATTETTVLLTGESGTGKEVIARAVHRASPRADGPFVAINCAALPDQLLESELFGFERGAFTGALSAKPGRIELAAGGVLFLDEAGEMSPVVQAKLLRVLQEREYQRLGGTRVLKADVRLVAATNRDLKSAIARGEFREDLYYRLHVFEIRLPPLRERPDDILPLTERFLAELGGTLGLPSLGVSREAKEILLAHPWPGNVRELRNALERAAILCEGGLITAAHLPISVARADAPGPASGALDDLPAGGVDLETLEKSLVEKALKRTGSNKSKAARLLGLTRAQLYSRLEKYGISG